MESRFYHSLPSGPGVYIFKDQKSKVLYIGKAVNLKNRVRSYFQSPSRLGLKTASLVSKIVSVSAIEVESEFEALILEASLIQKYQPKYNVELKDGKRYPYLRISVNEKFPRVGIVRKIEKDGALYFGPFPSKVKLRLILKTLRRIFLFRSSCRNLPKFSCLYYHLGECLGPCIHVDEDSVKAYRFWIKQLVFFLSGKRKSVLRTLEAQMRRAAKRLAFEEAQEIKKKIEQIELMVTPLRMPWEYEENPNLLFDRRTEELENLVEVLRPYFPKISFPERIECFDISNIQGRDAAGSMVVLVHGEPDSDSYRRFRIRLGDTPDDQFMMSEVISRRFKNDWELPDLIVVDGGKTQLSAAKKCLPKDFLDIPVIGLAKRLEQIVIPDVLNPVELPRNSKALLVLQRVRDEAHRFAISYHRLLRRKRLTL